MCPRPSEPSVVIVIIITLPPRPPTVTEGFSVCLPPKTGRTLREKLGVHLWVLRLRLWDGEEIGLSERISECTALLGPLRRGRHRGCFTAVPERLGFPTRTVAAVSHLFLWNTLYLKTQRLKTTVISYFSLVYGLANLGVSLAGLSGLPQASALSWATVCRALGAGCCPRHLSPASVYRQLRHGRRDQLSVCWEPALGTQLWGPSPAFSHSKGVPSLSDERNTI